MGCPHCSVKLTQDIYRAFTYRPDRAQGGHALWHYPLHRTLTRCPSTTRCEFALLGRDLSGARALFATCRSRTSPRWPCRLVYSRRMSNPHPPVNGAPGSNDASLQLQPNAAAVPSAPLTAPGPPPRSTWLTPVTVPLLVAIVALIAPITTAVYASYQAELKLDLERHAQADARTQLYLTRAIGAEAGAETRRQVLRFLAIQDGDIALQAWAKVELAELEEKVQTLQKEEENLAQEVVATRQEVVALSSDADVLEHKLATATEVGKVASVKAELMEVRKHLDVKRISEDEKTARLSRVGVQLHGPEAAGSPGSPTCSRFGFFDPMKPEDFELSIEDRRARARECDRSLANRAPPADATLSIDGKQWKWQLSTGTTCGCNSAP